MRRAEVDGVDFDKKVRMGIRNNRYDADCPTVTSALRRRRFVHEPRRHFHACGKSHGRDQKPEKSAPKK